MTIQIDYTVIEIQTGNGKDRAAQQLSMTARYALRGVTYMLCLYQSICGS